MKKKLCKKLLFLTTVLVFSYCEVNAKSFISIKKVTTIANLRAGPGNWYPVKWVIKNPNLPLKILEENDTYYKVELHEGTKGWLSKTLVSKKRNLIVTKDAKLSSKDGATKALVLRDYIIKKYNCDIKKINYCKVKIDKTNGYIEKENLWGYE